MSQAADPHDCPTCADARVELDRVRSTFTILMGHGDRNALDRLNRRAEELELLIYAHSGQVRPKRLSRP
jgi:hypothetical protein